MPAFIRRDFLKVVTAQTSLVQRRAASLCERDLLADLKTFRGCYGIYLRAVASSAASAAFLLQSIPRTAQGTSVGSMC